MPFTAGQHSRKLLGQQVQRQYHETSLGTCIGEGLRTRRCTPESAILPGCTLSSLAVLKTLQQHKDSLRLACSFTQVLHRCMSTRYRKEGSLHVIDLDELCLRSFISRSQVNQVRLGMGLQGQSELDLDLHRLQTDTHSLFLRLYSGALFTYSLTRILNTRDISVSCLIAVSRYWAS